MNAAAKPFDGSNKYVRITDINEESRQFSLSDLTSPEGAIEDKYKLREGDIVFARTGASVGKAYLYRTDDGNVLFAGFLIRFSITKADPYFVFCQTFRHEYWKWVMATSMRSGQPGLNAEEYKGYEFFLPESREQQKIAAFLSAVDRRIEQFSQKLSLLEQYKKGVMQQIFSRQIRFRDEKGNAFPDWEEKKLRDVCSVVGGGTPDTTKSEYWDGGIQWFTPTEIKNKYVTSSERTISKLGLNKSSAQILPSGAILLTTRATIGESSIALQECTTNQGFQSLIVKAGNNNEFIYYWLATNKHELLKKANGSTFKEIGRTEIHKISITLPALAEQTKIANFLSAIDAKIEVVKKQVENTRQFKKGLLQKMFV